ncbi:hypothetical protein QTP88_000685 [Uroleucon formosanum]
MLYQLFFCLDNEYSPSTLVQYTFVLAFDISNTDILTCTFIFIVSEQQLSVEDRRQLQLPVIVDECCTRRVLKMYCTPDN